MRNYIPFGRYRSILVSVFLIIAAWYLIWRLGSFNQDAPIFSFLLYFAEVYGLVTALLHIFMVFRLTDREPLPVIDGRSVDVFIPTINESVDMVRRTLIAAISMDYTHKTWILDDGNREEMKALAKKYGARYLSRLTNENAKAGNLNNALAHSDGEFICIFDADHCPQRNFITNTIGYFVDDNVSFVQTPQDFYNLDSYQHRQGGKNKKVWTEQSLFFRIIQRGKDYWNASFFCGSCAIIRRSSLEAINGFATGTLTEDLHTSIRLHKKGYRSIYMQQSMAYGVAPSSVAPFLSQRIRWGQGAMQVWKKEGIITARGLTLPQRLNYLASMMTYFDGWQKGLFYMAPVIVLTTGLMPISAINQEFLVRFIPYYLLSFLVFEEVGRGYGRILYIEQYNFSRFAAFAWSTLALFGTNKTFKVTNKNLTQKEVSRRFMAPQLIIVFLNFIAVPLGLFLFFYASYIPTEVLVANVMWASLNSGIALSLLVFTKNINKFQRGDYRFPIYLPAEIKIDSATSYVTVDNISSSGCKFYGALPPNAEVGKKISGNISLPGGILPFEGLIASKILSNPSDVAERYVKGVGCNFAWPDEHSRDVLDAFLYGSDLQWTLHRLSERIDTPLNWLMTKLGNKKTEQIGADYWGAVQYYYTDLSDSQVALGLKAESANTRDIIIITFTPLEAGREISVKTYSRMYQPLIRAHVKLFEKLESPGATLYIYNLLRVDTKNTNIINSEYEQA